MAMSSRIGSTPTVLGRVTSSWPIRLIRPGVVGAADGPDHGDGRGDGSGRRRGGSRPRRTGRASGRRRAKRGPGLARSVPSPALALLGRVRSPRGPRRGSSRPCSSRRRGAEPGLDPGVGADVDDDERCLASAARPWSRPSWPPRSASFLARRRGPGRGLVAGPVAPDGGGVDRQPVGREARSTRLVLPADRGRLLRDRLDLDDDAGGPLGGRRRLRRAGRRSGLRPRFLGPDRRRRPRPAARPPGRRTSCDADVRLIGAAPSEIDGVDGRDRDGVPDGSDGLQCNSGAGPGVGHEPAALDLPAVPEPGRPRGGGSGARAVAWSSAPRPRRRPSAPRARPGAGGPARGPGRRAARPASRSAAASRIAGSRRGRQRRSRPRGRSAGSGFRAQLVERLAGERRPLRGGVGQRAGQEQPEPVGPALAPRHGQGVAARVGRGGLGRQRLGQDVAGQAAAAACGGRCPSSCRWLTRGSRLRA